MIKLIENYEIHGNKYDYVLALNTGKVDKNGKPILKPEGYYNTVAACINACYHKLCRGVVAEKAMTLKEAVAEFEAIQRRLEELIPEVLK